MSAPFQVLCVSAQPVDLWGSPYGPFVLHPVPGLDDAARELQVRAHDALLIELPTAADLAALQAWPALSHAVLDAAVVLVHAEPEVPAVLSLLQFGVQDVLPPADAPGLARTLRLAIERKRIEMAARKAYATDLATGLPNHMQLLEHMTHLVALRAREPAPMALIVLRIEGLAATEAALGAEAANVLKRKAAVRLRSGLRASDVVASIGGDAFAVLLAWIDAPDDGERVAAKLAQSLAQPFSVTGRERLLRVRVGLAQFPAHGERVEDLMRRALGQAASVATVGRADYAHAADRGPSAAANDEG
ncbi:MAG: GGDEF domain-containing protein [Rubrivivax sp.]